MRFQKSLVLAGAAAAFAACVATTHADVIVLDTFDGPQGALGQNRTLVQDVFSNPYGWDEPLVTTVNEGAGAYLFAAKTGVAGTGWVVYDGFGDGLDAVALGVTGFQLDFADADQDFHLVIELDTYDDGGGIAGTATATATVNAAMVDVAIEDFSFAGAFDPTNIDQVSLKFNLDGAAVALDFALTEFSAIIPAPPAFALLAFGLAGTRRRRA